MGDFMDFYNRQRSPIYDGRGNVIGYNHGYGEREDFDKPIPRSEYKGPGHDMGESRRPRRDIVTRPTRDLNNRWDPADEIPKMGPWDPTIEPPVMGPKEQWDPAEEIPVMGPPVREPSKKPEPQKPKGGGWRPGPARPVFTKPAEPVYTPPAEPVYTPPARPVYTPPARPKFANPVWEGDGPPTSPPPINVRPRNRRRFGYDSSPEMGGDRGGRRDYDIDLGRWEPMNQRPRRGRSERRDGWWNEPRRPEPRRPAPPRPTEYSERLSSDAERMRLLSGESDTIQSPDSSRPLRDNYDPVDIDFNRQFSEAPRGRQPWHSDPTGNPLERDPLSDYDFREGRSTNRRAPKPPGPPRSARQPNRNRRNVKNRR